MIGYALVGSNDMEKAAAFYDALFATMGVSRLFVSPRGGVVYGSGWDKPMFGVNSPFNEKPATVGNGSMVAFAAGSRANVDKLHAKVLALGGADEGAPGLRGPEEFGFYGSYCRDLDGNKLCFYHAGPAD